MSIRSTARSFTEAARGFSATSCSLGGSDPRVSSRTEGPVPGSSTGSSIGPVLRALSAKARLTIRSSSDWYDITTSRPFGASRSSAARHGGLHRRELRIYLDA
nr:hypothetical protein GCM10020092_085960 [Actinoplanes digitatis]